MSEGEVEAAMILVVEDNPANLLLTRALLRRGGYRMVEARSLAEARGVLETVRPDLVVLDRGLDDGDGLELMGQLNASGIPALVVSAYAMPEERERALRAGAARYLTKPLDTRTFTATLEAILREARPDRTGG